MKVIKQAGIYRRVAVCLMLAGLVPAFPSYSQNNDELVDELTVHQIMTAIIAPMTSTIWGAYDIQSDETWQNLQNAAISVMAAAQLLQSTGEHASEPDWRRFNQQMFTAARASLTAIAEKNEEALFNAGNDQLYPPCESCHMQYMAQ